MQLPQFLEPDPSRRSSRALRIYAAFVFGLIVLAALSQIYQGAVIVDARLRDGSPEFLLREPVDLWVPTSWTQYVWEVSKPFVLIPFGIAGVALAYWHDWEIRHAAD